MNMKKISLDSWVQLIGMLNVFADLVFVGLDLLLWACGLGISKSKYIRFTARKFELHGVITTFYLC